MPRLKQTRFPFLPSPPTVQEWRSVQSEFDAQAASAMVRFQRGEIDREEMESIIAFAVRMWTRAENEIAGIEAGR